MLNTITNSVKLPSLILKPQDIYSYSLIIEEPNFISVKKPNPIIQGFRENISSSNLEKDCYDSICRSWL